MGRALTGIRPTGDLTVANYVGAMQPMVDLQETFDGEVNVFVADLHGLTDQEPEVVNRTRLDVVRAYMAAGVDPDETLLYLQSQIGAQTVELASLLDRHTTVAELMRIPTLKDKLKAGQTENQATVSLARYPILMAADIAIQGADIVPVGQDQLPHIEFTRALARRFNNAYGDGEEILVPPQHLAMEAIRITSLVDGDAKMSKSQPRGAILLTDTPNDAAKKIKGAQTANPGEMTPALESHVLLSKRLSGDPEVAKGLDVLIARHKDGEKVMGVFKQVMTGIVTDFLGEYQERLTSVSDAEVKAALRSGGERATEQADRILGNVHAALGIVSSRFLYE